MGEVVPPVVIPELVDAWADLIRAADRILRWRDAARQQIGWHETDTEFAAITIGPDQIAALLTIVHGTPRGTDDA